MSNGGGNQRLQGTVPRGGGGVFNFQFFFARVEQLECTLDLPTKKIGNRLEGNFQNPLSAFLRSCAPYPHNPRKRKIVNMFLTWVFRTASYYPRERPPKVEDDGELAKREVDDRVVRPEGTLLRWRGRVESAEEAVDGCASVVCAAAEGLDGGGSVLALGGCESTSGVGAGPGRVAALRMMMHDSCKAMKPRKPRPTSLRPLASGSVNCILTAPPRRVAKHSSEVYNSMPTHNQ